MSRIRSRSQTLRRAQEQLTRHLASKGLKQTRQRDAILETFIASSGHVTSDDLYERVRADHPEIGAATVYRTLKLFCDSGVASARFFRDGVTLYEYEDEHHHDHLICVGCGEIIEFESDIIEREQSRVAERFGYRLTHHRHHLYGYCAKCRKNA